MVRTNDIESYREPVICLISSNADENITLYLLPLFSEYVGQYSRILAVLGGT